MALLQAAGYSPGYGFGLMEMPYHATDGTANDLQHWLQLNLVNTHLEATSINFFSYLLGDRGYRRRNTDMQDSNHVLRFSGYG